MMASDTCSVMPSSASECSWHIFHEMASIQSSFGLTQQLHSSTVVALMLRPQKCDFLCSGLEQLTYVIYKTLDVTSPVANLAS